MITWMVKPSCLRMPDGTYYKNSVWEIGMDYKLLKMCYRHARQAKKNWVFYLLLYDCPRPYLMRLYVIYFTEPIGKAFFHCLKGFRRNDFEITKQNMRKKIK